MVRFVATLFRTTEDHNPNEEAVHIKWSHHVFPFIDMSRVIMRYIDIDIILIAKELMLMSCHSQSVYQVTHLV